MAAWVSLVPPAIIAQSKTSSYAAQSSDKKTTPVKPKEFAVVSIRPSNPNAKSGGFKFLPDGYQSINSVLGVSILMAYIPQDLWSPDRIVGAPPWVNKTRYDIVAKVDQEDIAMWQKQNLRQKGLLEQMLQRTLAERFKLILHHVPGQVLGYALVVKKQGPAFKEAIPDGKPPPGIFIPFPEGGGIVPKTTGEKPQMGFIGTSMSSLAAYLDTATPGHPVVDKTGLKGKYDFVLSMIDSDGGGAVSSVDPNPAYIWNVEALGLKLVPIKLPIDTLVIDHIELPSTNQQSY